MHDTNRLDESPRIRAITFDLDDTLWEIWPIIERAEQRLHDWLMQRYPRIVEMYTPLELRDLSVEVLKEHPHVAHDRTVVRKKALRLAATAAGYEEFHVDSAFEVFFVARNEVEFFEDVLPSLQRLSHRYRLGALSNGNADIFRVGLGDIFDFAINAIDVGVPKPEPAMFKAACALLDLAPSQIVHVGDEPEHDIRGAARAGYRTVWVNRTGKPWPGGDPADAEIRTLDELEGILAQWAANREDVGDIRNR